MNKLMLLSFLALMVPATAVATINSGGDAFRPEKGLDLGASFSAQREAINRALGDGETYSELAPDDVQVVQQSMARISRLLGSAQSIDQLPELTRVEIFNEQERINTLLVRAHADSRMVCRREKPTGSNRPTNVCLTVAERRRHQEAASNFFRYNPRSQGEVPVK